MLRKIASGFGPAVAVWMAGGLACFAPALRAQDWTLRVDGFALDSDASFSERANSERVEVDTGGGVSFGFEYRFADHLGFDIGGIAGGGVEVDVISRSASGTTVTSGDTLGLAAFVTGLYFHPAPADAVADVYLGPLLAYVSYSSIDFFVEDNDGNDIVRVGIASDDDVALGATLGIDTWFAGGNWSFNANLKYLASTFSSGPRSIDLDQVLLGFGFGFRF